jgi:rhamnulokinase
MPINTIYQLSAAMRDTPALLKTARQLVMIPDLFHYWLTGKAVCEYTNATTTQLVNPVTRTWAAELIKRLELPSHLLTEIVEPGTRIGTLLPSISRGAALSSTPVIAPATHDTGSAVAAISAREGTAFLSSGTWSLLGTELDAPVISTEALRLNFTNEGGVNGTTRLLKNVMGLWMLQCCRQAWTVRGQSYEHSELMELAACEDPFRCLVDPDHPSFLRPADMPATIDQFCARTHQPSPKTQGAYVRTILESLAFKYRLVLQNLEQLIGRPIDRIRVIGGGSKNRLLNQMTADATGRSVVAGPAEATALGNVAVQILATGGATSINEVRNIIDRSFPMDRFEPINPGKWDRHAERFEQYCEAVYA